MPEVNHEQDSREPTEEEVWAFLDTLPGKLSKEDKELLASLPWSLEELTKEQTPESLKRLVGCLTVNLAFIHASRRGYLTEEEREILIKRKEQLASLKDKSPDPKPLKDKCPDPFKISRVERNQTIFNGVVCLIIGIGCIILCCLAPLLIFAAGPAAFCLTAFGINELRWWKGDD